MLWCRVSDAEYEELSQLCVVSGARSVSEAVRFAVRKVLLLKSDPENTVENQTRQLEARLQVLDYKLDELRGLLLQFSAAPQSEPPKVAAATSGGTEDND